MQERALDFEWPVFPAYHWQEWWDTDGNPVIVTEDVFALDSYDAVIFAIDRMGETGPVLGPVHDSGPSRLYRPMDRADLFLRFVALDPENQEAILGFASEYGLLGLPPADTDLTDEQRRGRNPTFQYQDGMFPTRDGRADEYHRAEGEPQLGWAVEIYQMREALRLTEQRTSKGDTRTLTHLFDRHLQGVQGRMDFSGTSSRMLYKPQSLLAGMWAKLAESIAGEKRFVACKQCGRFFEISTEPSGFRRHREYCSDACKSKHYRLRKHAALELAAKGTPLSRIAKLVRAETPTVRGWLAAPSATGKPKK